MSSNENKRTVLISILNWNAGDLTLRCVASVMGSHTTEAMAFRIIVIDNGSGNADLSRLVNGLPSDVLLHQERSNLGFTGGQNIGIQYALEHGFDYVWLLNNDTTVHPDALAKIVDFMERDMGCGAASPVVRSSNAPGHFDFVGARHDWRYLTMVRFNSVAEAEQAERSQTGDEWLQGTALMLRVGALRQVGRLNDKLFAYYDDDDISMRLNGHGWRCRLVLDAEVSHVSTLSPSEERPPYYFYLMSRNRVLFFIEHTPKGYRRFIRTRLFEASVLWSYRLEKAGFKEKADACMLGACHGVRGKGGPIPNMQTLVPLWGRLLRRLFWLRIRSLL